MEWKRTYKGFWIAKNGKKYYMKSYNFAPLSKRPIVKQITKEEYKEYEKCVVNF